MCYCSTWDTQAYFIYSLGVYIPGLAHDKLSFFFYVCTRHDLMLHPTPFLHIVRFAYVSDTVLSQNLIGPANNTNPWDAIP